MPSSTLTLTAADGFKSLAYLAEPSGTPKGAIVVLQEIFGVNSHIRGVADGYAAAGYLAVAPSTFDRVGRDVQLGYTPDDMGEGMRLKGAVEALPAPGVLLDIQAAVDHAARAGKVGIVGYCWGGLLVWRSAEQVRGFAAAVAYYGGGIQDMLELAPQIACPMQFHYGALDANIPLSAVDKVRAAMQGRDAQVHVYDSADHGFNCWARGSYQAASAALAHGRALQFLASKLF